MCERVAEQKKKPEMTLFVRCSPGLAESSEGARNNGAIPEIMQVNLELSLQFVFLSSRSRLTAAVLKST
jgi:hypothetical protein